MLGWLILIAVIIIILGLSIRIVPQGSAYVVERLGRYQATWNSGPHLLVPFIDTVRRRVLVKEQVADFAPYLGAFFQKAHNKAVLTLSTGILGSQGGVF